MSDSGSNGWDDLSDPLDEYYDDPYYNQDNPSINSSTLESLDNDIENDETHLDEHPIQNLSYCIGIYFTQYDDEWNATDFIFMQRISTTMFYKYSSEILEEYLIDYSNMITRHNHEDENREILVNDARLEIIQIHFEYPSTENVTTTLEPSYGVVVKTIWLKLIQREWKKHCAKIKQNNEEMIKKRCLPSNHFYSQTHGRYPYGLNISKKPSLKGLMYLYSSPHSHPHSHPQSHPHSHPHSSSHP